MLLSGLSESSLTTSGHQAASDVLNKTAELTSYDIVQLRINIPTVRPLLTVADMRNEHSQDRTLSWFHLTAPDPASHIQSDRQASEHPQQG